MKKIELKTLFSKINIRFWIGRIGLALVAFSLVVVLILWDSGKIDLPFLERKDRREPITETKEEETETIVLDEIDYDAFAEKLLSSLYRASALENFSSLYTTEAFDGDTMSLVKTALVGKNYQLAYGYLIKDEIGAEALFTLPTLETVPDAKDYTFTGLLDRNGEAVFQKGERIK